MELVLMSIERVPVKIDQGWWTEYSPKSHNFSPRRLAVLEERYAAEKAIR